MYNKIKEKQSKIAVIGLGYVGLPLALEFAKQVKVVGFDIKQERIDLMKENIDPSKELENKDFLFSDITFSSKVEDIKDCCFYIIAVPTPINDYKLPDLKPLLSATKTVASVLKKGDYVVYESTVYPSCTEDDCVPLLEQISGLKFKEDFKVGFSPERINPGDKVHSLTKILKITSGCDAESSETIAKVYELIIKAGVHRASSIKVAEAAKIIENTQRDVNIALMNELSQIFNLMNINTYEVLEAAKTKWNFLPFSPGLVGGHCIGVDPYYLLHKANELGYHAQIIGSGRAINDNISKYVAQNTIKLLISKGKEITKSKVLVLGITFKENVADIRNSKIIDILQELASYRIEYHVLDPFADAKEVEDIYKTKLHNAPEGKYDAVIIAVNHNDYINYNEQTFENLLNDNGIIIDIKGIYRNKIQKLTYWSL